MLDPLTYRPLERLGGKWLLLCLAILSHWKLPKTHMQVKSWRPCWGFHTPLKGLGNHWLQLARERGWNASHPLGAELPFSTLQSLMDWVYLDSHWKSVNVLNHRYCGVILKVAITDGCIPQVWSFKLCLKKKIAIFFPFAPHYFYWKAVWSLHESNAFPF